MSVRLVPQSELGRYIALRNRELDRVRFTGERPKLEEYAALLHRIVETDGVRRFERAAIIGDDLVEVELAALATSYTSRGLYRQTTDMAFLREAAEQAA